MISEKKCGRGVLRKERELVPEKSRVVNVSVTWLFVYMCFCVSLCSEKLINMTSSSKQTNSWTFLCMDLKDNTNHWSTIEYQKWQSRHFYNKLPLEVFLEKRHNQISDWREFRENTIISSDLTTTLFSKSSLKWLYWNKKDFLHY